MSNRLDLHGKKHVDVEILVEDFILTNETPIYIITGNSKVMQDIVIKVLNLHNFKWLIKAHNLGEIIVL